MLLNQTISRFSKSALIVSLLTGMSTCQAIAYNSEEHKLITDLGTAGLSIPSYVRFPAKTGMVRVDKGVYRKGIINAKKLAVGYGTNNKSDYDKWKQGVQDNYYWKGFGQSDYNKDIWIPPLNMVPGRMLTVSVSYLGNKQRFTLGELVALYGDYRKTVYYNSGQCFLTNSNFPHINFLKGTEARKYAPKSIQTYLYLRRIGSGLVPPYGSAGNTFSNTAKNKEYSEAGWWGDEMLRLANINDWHFSNAAVAWYVGMHRLALLSVEKARTNPDYWVRALHYEANALHSLTDLFAFGHVVTNRDETAAGIIKRNGLQNSKTYKWMENVIKMGGGYRTESGRVGLKTKLPPITQVPVSRNDFLTTNRGKFAPAAKLEHHYHNEFNDEGTWVYNLNGVRFKLYGDKKLRSTSSSSRRQMTACVRDSVQSLFKAYEDLGKGKSVETIGARGSSYFKALRYIPVYIDSNSHFKGQWVRYAGYIDTMTGLDRVPSDWKKCRIPYVGGTTLSIPTRTTKCTAFPPSPTGGNYRKTPKETQDDLKGRKRPGKKKPPKKKPPVKLIPKDETKKEKPKRRVKKRRYYKKDSSKTEKNSDKIESPKTRGSKYSRLRRKKVTKEKSED